MTSNVSIHRLLDEAFATASPTETTQDLKEELRANLMARVAELESDGLDASAAARQAFDELGDISGLLTDPVPDARPGRPSKVRPSAAFVARVTVVPIVASAALGVAVLAALDVVGGGPYLARGLVAVVAVLVGFVTADALLRETTGHYGMPRGRATGYGVGTGLVLLGAGLVALCRTDGLMWWWVTLGGLLAVAGIGVLAGLGATQTNRTKPWMLASASAFEADNRFETDPAAAARFGIYTLVTWVAAAAASVVVGFTVGWWWAVLPWVVAAVVTMLLLTRMLFTPVQR